MSEATRQRVLEVAKEIGYQPNVLARVMKGKETGLLGIILRDGSAPTGSELCRTLMRKAPCYGYDIVLTDAANSASTLLRLANLMKSRLCDGLFLVGELPDQDMHWDAYERIGVPTVALLHGQHEAYPGVKVWADARPGLEQALDHLRALGHRRIGYVGSDLLHGLKERGDIFAQLMEEHHLPLRREHFIATDFSRDGGAEALRKLMSLSSPPTAVVACTDLMASGMLQEARRLGVSVPTDLSVVGYDDNSTAALCYPALTTVRQPLTEMAELALDWFRARRGGVIPPPENLKVGTELVVRDSTTTVAHPRSRPTESPARKKLRGPSGPRRRRALPALNASRTHRKTTQI